MPRLASAAGPGDGTSPGRSTSNFRRVLDDRTFAVLLAVLCLVVAGCGGTKLTRRSGPTNTVDHQTPSSDVLSNPVAATKNTTRIPAADSITAAALVSLAVFPSAAPGTHPTAVALTSNTDWQAALAASVLMGGRLHAPLLYSDATTMPPTTQAALNKLAPTGEDANGVQVVRIGDVPKLPAERSVSISGNDPYTLAAKIDKFSGALGAGRPARDVIIASGIDAAYAMPAAGYAAESDDPILFVTRTQVPAATRQALLVHHRPHIYVLGPSSVISDQVLAELGRYGTVKRITGSSSSAEASAVAFAAYRDPPCPVDAACPNIPGSFGWSVRSPGHGFTLINASRPLDAAAAAALSGAGTFGPQLLISDPAALPAAVQNYFLDYATPGYTAQGPIAAVYNHAWIIGDQSAVSVSVQAELDRLLEPRPVNK